MAISFPHSTRVLRNDGLIPTAVALAVVGLILLAWGAWAVLARVPITATCAQATVNIDGTLLAHCPPEQIGKIRQGAPAVVMAATADGRLTFNAVVLRVPNASARRLAPDTIEVHPFSDRALAPGTSVEVHITLAEASPLELILRSRQGR
jgi:hypothetical protein